MPSQIPPCLFVQTVLKTKDSWQLQKKKILLILGSGLRSTEMYCIRLTESKKSTWNRFKWKMVVKNSWFPKLPCLILNIHLKSELVLPSFHSFGTWDLWFEIIQHRLRMNWIINYPYETCNQLTISIFRISKLKYHVLLETRESSSFYKPIKSLIRHAKTTIEKMYKFLATFCTGALNTF